ncbi:MAG: glycosyltransferase [Candidatus Woesearchaeota archaeon]|jgi:glycosyltransferase involved in cell wall biosynthesis
MQHRLTELQPTISLCMIIKNEEEWLQQCLDSVKDLVSEMIIVDTGSTDNTKAIAKKNGAKVFDFTWTDDFAAARNFSISKATCDWILWIDADETIASIDHDIIKKLIEEAQFPLIILEQRHYTHDSKNLLFKKIDDRYKQQAKGFEGYTSTLTTRLFKNKIGLQFEGVVHETLDKSMLKLKLKFLRTDIPIHHYQNMKSDSRMKMKQEKYDTLLVEKEKQDPKDIKNLHDLAITAMQQEDLSKAFSYFKKIYDLDAELLEPHLGMGLIWAKRGDYPRAIKFFLTAMSKKTTRTIELSIPITMVRETIIFNLALCYLRVGNRSQALHIFKDMIRLNSRFTPQIQEKMRQMGITGTKPAA